MKMNIRIFSMFFLCSLSFAVQASILPHILPVLNSNLHSLTGSRRCSSLLNCAELLSVRDAGDLAIRLAEEFDEYMLSNSLGVNSSSSVIDNLGYSIRLSLPASAESYFDKLWRSIVDAEIPASQKAILLLESLTGLVSEAIVINGIDVLESKVNESDSDTVYKIAQFSTRGSMALIRPFKICQTLRNRSPELFGSDFESGWRDSTGLMNFLSSPSALLYEIGRYVPLSGVGVRISDSHETTKIHSDLGLNTYDPIDSHLWSLKISLACGNPCSSRETRRFGGDSFSVYEAHGMPEWDISKYLTAFAASSTELSPDLLFLSPSVGNCLILRNLALHHHAYKVLWVPVDPRGDPDKPGMSGYGNLCSISELLQVVDEWYFLERLEVNFAVLIHKNIQRIGKFHFRQSLYDKWLAGWVCNPSSKALPDNKLDNIDIIDKMTVHFGPFTDRGLRIAEVSGRAHCWESICECLPPWRGDLCNVLDESRMPQSAISVSIHYLTSNSESHLNDLRFALKNLWNSFNQAKDYPVIVFYDSWLTEQQRIEILESSENRVWIIQSWFDQHTRKKDVESFKERPSLFGSSASFHNRPIGYRNVCRFESGPVFVHPAMRNFRITVRMDTDGYFAGDAWDWLDVPSQLLGVSLTESKLGLFSGLVAVAGSRVNHLDEVVDLFRVYKNDSEMDASWNQFSAEYKNQGIMITVNSPPYVFDLNFFAGREYQEWFKFVDAWDGFERFGFLGNGVITAGLVLVGKVASIAYMRAPTAHQIVCYCDFSRGGLNDHVCVASESNQGILWNHGTGKGLGSWKCVQRGAIESKLIEGRCRPYDLSYGSTHANQYWCD